MVYAGHRFSLWDSYGLGDYTLRAGSFSEDGRGRWYLNVCVEVAVGVSEGTRAIGIDLGLKTAVKKHGFPDHCDCASEDICQFMQHREASALTPHAPAQSQLDALREEVARLKAAAQESALQYLSDNGQWIEETGRLRAELAALKAQPTDVDALMALADEMAEWAGERFGSGFRHYESAREALRAKLAARKEPA